MDCPQIAEHLNLRSHWDTLVDIGAVAKQEYRFVYLSAPTAESKHFIRRCLARDCPPFLDHVSVYPDSPEPMVITIWHEHEYRDEWRECLKAADTPNYREQFIAELHSASPE